MARPAWLSIPFGAAAKGPQAQQAPSTEKLKLSIPTDSTEKQSATQDGLSESTLTVQPSSDRNLRHAHLFSQSEEDAVEDINAPIRVWLVVTMFPLIASTFGPMASAFNICAIAIDWRTHVNPNSTESEGAHIRDPRWLVAVNVTSLVIAIIANLFLLAQMTKRIRFSIAAPVTIVGWYISGFIDIGLVAAAPRNLPLPTDGLSAYSQAYYYACFAGALYVILSIMLSCTAVGIWIFRFSDEFKLSMSQRSLMLQTMMYLGYLLAAGAVYARVESEDYLDAVYYANVTIFTIGLGDYSPKTHLGRALLFPMAIGGILFVGLIIANIRSLVLESCSRKINIRVIEKARASALAKGDPDRGEVRVKGIRKRRTIDGDTELQRREQEFMIMREILSSAAKQNRRITLAIATASFFLLWILGAVAFWEAESAVGGQGWSYFESLYFTYVALLTIGYGDFYPQSNSAKPTFVFWSLIALPTLTVLIGSIGDVVTDSVNSGMAWFDEHKLRISKAWAVLREGVHHHHHEAGPGSSIDDSHVHVLEHVAHQEAQSAVSQFMISSPLSAIEPGKKHYTSEEAVHAYRPYVVIREIKKLVSDIDGEGEQHYTFKEWTRLLRLLDEDEATSPGHRMPGKADHADVIAAPPPLKDASQGWSWLGQESPLMSNESESKWLLTRLLHVLETELKCRGDHAIISKIPTR